LFLAQIPLGGQGLSEAEKVYWEPWERESVENGINLKVTWFDEVENLMEIVFRCSNGFFSGQAEIYVGGDDLSEFAGALSRFPSRSDDSRDFELGTFNPDHADGGARMRFFCTDAVGHAVVEVKLRGDACRAVGEMQSVALCIPIQAAGVDEFIKQLRAIGKTLGATAHLPQATS
jgi:hypothetical protein